MNVEPRFSYWEVPARIYFFDWRYDIEFFEQAMEYSLDEISLIDDSDAVVRDRIEKHWGDALNAIKSKKKFLGMFCWVPQYNTLLPFFSPPFEEEDVEAIRRVVKTAVATLIKFKCNRFELIVMHEHNRLLLFALQAALELELAQFDIDAIIAKDVGYDS